MYIKYNIVTIISILGVIRSKHCTDFIVRQTSVDWNRFYKPTKLEIN